MVRFAELAALTLVVSAPALTLGIAPAKAELCDGTWHAMGNRQMQCYYLPTVSNGGVERLELPSLLLPGAGPHRRAARQRAAPPLRQPVEVTRRTPDDELCDMRETRIPDVALLSYERDLEVGRTILLRIKTAAVDIACAPEQQVAS